MRAAARLMLGLTLAVPGLFAGEAATAQAPANRPAAQAPAGNQPAANMSHTHLGHVADRFNDTPQSRGLLATATAEAGTAAQHAGLAGQQPDNLEYMKQHTVHVLNAIDPTVEATGPGLGYGVKKAATLAVQHMEMAATAPNASVAMGIHANHIVVATKNVVRWSDELIAIGKQIQASTDAATAAGLIKQMAALADKIANGNDVNTDGTISWQEGEGGLRQAESISTLLKRAEGLAGEP